MVVQVPLVVACVRRRSGSDGDVDLLDGELNDLVLIRVSDVASGNNVGRVGSILDRGRGSDAGGRGFSAAGFDGAGLSAESAASLRTNAVTSTRSGHGDDDTTLSGGGRGRVSGRVRKSWALRERGRRRRGRTHGRRSNTSAASDWVFGSWLWAPLNGDIDRKTVARAVTVVAVEGLRQVEFALGTSSVVLEVEQRAVGDLAGLALALVKSALQEVLRFPAHDEVAVVASALGVTVRQEEHSIITGKVVGGPDCLEEEEGVVDIIALRAVALLDQAGVGNVRLVVRRVLLAGTAAREGKLNTNPVLAVGVEVVLLWHFVTVERRFWVLGVVQAVEAEGALTQPVLVGGVIWPAAQLRVWEWASEVAEMVVSSNHLEALWERLDVLEVVKVVTRDALATEWFCRVGLTTYANMPPTWLTITVVPLLYWKYKAGVQ